MPVIAVSPSTNSDNWYDNASGGTLPKIQSGSHLIVTTII